MMAMQPLLCSTHQKLRDPQYLSQVVSGDFSCLPGHECKPVGSKPERDIRVLCMIHGKTRSKNTMRLVMDGQGGELWQCGLQHPCKITPGQPTPLVLPMVQGVPTLTPHLITPAFVAARAKSQPASSGICLVHNKSRDMAHLVYQNGGLVCRAENVCKVSIKETDQVETCSVHQRVRQKQYMAYDSIEDSWHCIAPNECKGAEALPATPVVPPSQPS